METCFPSSKKERERAQRNKDGLRGPPRSIIAWIGICVENVC